MQGTKHKILKKEILKNGICRYATSVERPNGEYVDVYWELLQDGGCIIGDGGYTYFYLMDCGVQLDKLTPENQTIIRYYSNCLGYETETSWTLTLPPLKQWDSF